MEFRKKTFLIVGFGISAKSACDFIMAKGGIVYFTKNTAFQASEVEEIRNLKCEYLDFEGQNKLILQGKADYLVVSPAVPLNSELCKLARANKVEIMSEVELGTMNTKATIVGITGTNGKTTATTLLDAIIRGDNKVSKAVGNIGVPITKYANILTQDDFAVMELSSFQLEETTSLKPHVACILNITPDHLDRHKTMENYIEAKSNIIKYQRSNDYFVCNLHDELICEIAKKTKGKVVYFSHLQKTSGAYIDGENICYNNDEFIVSVNSINLRGAHNLQNVLAVITMAKILGISNVAIAKTLQAFTGIEHRLKLVSVIDEVSYFNDSKATNPDSTVMAVNSFKEDLYLIMGGMDSDLDYSKLVKNFPKNLQRVFVVGENSEKIVKAIGKYGAVRVTRASTLREGVLLARYFAKSGDVVLFSPASKSFDKYKNFEQRGTHFVSIVESINGKRK